MIILGFLATCSWQNPGSLTRDQTWAHSSESVAPSRAQRLGSCLILGKELSEETCADKSRDFIGRGHPSGEQQSKGTQENCSATWLAVSGFMLMGLVSGLSLASHFDSESFLVAHHIAQPRWMLVRTLPVGDGLFVLCSLPGPPIVK